MAKSAAKKKKKTAAQKKTAKKKASKKKASKKKASKKKASTGTNGTTGKASSATKKKRSAAKRKAALAIVASTSDRMAVRAKTSVYAISSEKTLEQFTAIEARSDGIEADRMSALIDLATESATPLVRRSVRDPFSAFRAELNRQEDDPEDVHAPWRLANQRLRHELSPPAPLEDLEAFEARIRKKLPPSYWDFCLEWNGGLLYVHQGGRYRILAPNEVMAEIQGPLCRRMAQPYLPLVDLGCNDYLALDMDKANKSKENPLYWWYAGEIKRKVADSFALWLRRVVEGGGTAYWWNL